MTSIIGHQLVNLKIETVHFDINIDMIAYYCTNLEDLSVINARLCVTHPTEKPPYFASTKVFTKLKKVYLFLVTYLTDTAQDHLREGRGAAPANITDPTRVRHPVTGIHYSMHSRMTRS